MQDKNFSIISQYSDEELIKIVNKCTSYSQLSKALGYSAKGRNNYTIKKRLQESRISTEHFTNLPAERVKRSPSNVFVENSTASQHTLRRWYKKGNYSEYKCSICGQEPVWNGKTLELTLDHINGTNNDDRLENLRWVCPNCDRQLDTFAGRNLPDREGKIQRVRKTGKCQVCGNSIGSKSQLCSKCFSQSKKSKIKPSQEDLKKLLLESNGNFSKVSRLFGVTSNAVVKWCKSYNMDYHSKDYKNIGL